MNASAILTTILNNLHAATARQFRDGSSQVLMMEWDIPAPTLARSPAWLRAANRAQNALMRAGESCVFTIRPYHGSMYLRIRAPLRECSSAPSVPCPSQPHIHDGNTRMLAGHIASGATWRLPRLTPA